MARDSTESRFRQVLEDFGGAQNVLLIGELWDRAQSRDLLESFLDAVFPGEKQEGVGKPNAKVPQSSLAECKGPQEPVSDSREQPVESPVTRESERRQLKPDRALRFPLVFFLCRAESLRPRDSRRHLREILKDLRERTREGAAVIGVIVTCGSAATNGESLCDGSGQDNSDGFAGDSSQDSLAENVASLLSLLQSVFPPGSRGSRWWEVRAAVFLQGQDETRKDVQNVASEALAAAGKPEPSHHRCLCVQLLFFPCSHTGL
ncbi:hypothetical protein XELAEV_18003975mg [Xenopus laevis]|uniref:Uncharacterized protein n=1 Tax=Xenopus laevis TaxID=8355 RepID=A0A974BPN2_XENLA|nr:hypothetical protein XELAEV_18003975mg [Xenopus laevis]